MKYFWYRIGYGLSRLIFTAWMKSLHSIKIFGEENIPGKGSFIYAPNHVSLGDPPIAGVSCKKRPLHFMAKKELFENKRWGWWFKWLQCIPLNRNKNDFGAIKKALQKLEKGRGIVIFPEGTRSESGELKNPQLGIGFIAFKSKAPVIPLFISGSEKALSRDGVYSKGVPIKAYIGKKVDFSGIENIDGKKEKYYFISRKVMEAISGLRDNALKNER